MKRALPALAALVVGLAACACSVGSAGCSSGPSSTVVEPFAQTALEVRTPDGGCAPGRQRCVGGTTREICLPGGQWGDSWTCATGACSAGLCTGSTTSGPSCAPGGAGMTDCGAAAESCCTSLEVEGGRYYRTFANPGDGGTDLADVAGVRGLRLDRYPVTVGRFRQFVGAWNGGAGYLPPAGSGKHAHLRLGRGLANVGAGGGDEPGWIASDDANVAPTDHNLACYSAWETWTPSAGDQENLPINCVNAYEAQAFCIWDGGFLPSEAEREYAAAGGAEQRAYPWGEADPGTASQYAIYGCYFGGGGSCTGVSNIAPVGTATLGAGKWGQLNLAGEVWEWTLDWWAPYVSPCGTCANVTPALRRVIRGGNFGVAASELLATVRQSSGPATRYSFGFRCARTP